MSGAHRPPCISCAGKGWRWQRGRTGEARMVKRPCGTCKGTGRAKIKIEGP